MTSNTRLVPTGDYKPRIPRKLLANHKSTLKVFTSNPGILKSHFTIKLATRKKEKHNVYGIDLVFGHMSLVLLTLSVTTTRKGDLLPRSRRRKKIHARTMTFEFFHRAPIGPVFRR